MSAQSQTTFRADTRLVEVNALVTDKDGRPLAGLTRDDFTVLEDGKPQAIELFAVDGRWAAAATPAAGVAAATGRAGSRRCPAANTATAPSRAPAA